MAENQKYCFLILLLRTLPACGLYMGISCPKGSYWSDVYDYYVCNDGWIICTCGILFPQPTAMYKVECCAHGVITCGTDYWTCEADMCSSYDNCYTCKLHQTGYTLNVVHDPCDSCIAGYLGSYCNEDVDECASDNAGCHNNAMCENLAGSYRCNCPGGYTMNPDSHSCSDCPDPLEQSLHAEKSSTDTTISSIVHITCLSGYTRVHGDSPVTCYRRREAPYDGLDRWGGKPTICTVLGSGIVLRYVDPFPKRKYLLKGTTVEFTIYKYRGDFLIFNIYWGTYSGYYEIMRPYKGIGLYSDTFSISHTYTVAGIDMIPTISYSNVYGVSGGSGGPYVVEFGQSLIFESVPSDISITPTPGGTQTFPTTITYTATVVVDTYEQSATVYWVEYGDGTFSTRYGYSFSQSHIYSHPGTYQATALVYNHVAHNKSYVPATVTLNDQMKNDVILLKTSSPAGVPDGQVEFSVEIKEGEDTAPGIELYFEYGDTANTDYTVERSKTSNLTMWLPYNVTFYYTRNDVPQKSGKLTATDWNSQQNIVNFVVDIEERISGIDFVLNTAFTLRKGEVARFTITIAGGSNVIYNMTYGDGDGETYDHPALFASDAPVSFVHTYPTPGRFLPMICLLNKVTDICSNLSDWVTIQNPVQTMDLFIPAMTPVPPGQVTFSIKPIYTASIETAPTDVQVQWTLSNGESVLSNAPELSYHQQYDQEFIFNASSSGTVEVAVKCFNHISEVLLSGQTEIIDALTDLHVTASTYIAAVFQDVTFTVQATSGSHVTCNFIPGNGSILTGSFLSTKASETPLVFTQQYTRKFNYSVDAECWNEISKSNIRMPKLMIIQNPVTNLNISKDLAIPFPDGHGIFIITPDPNTLTPSEVWITWSMVNVPSFTYFSNDLSQGRPQLQENSFDESYIGKHLVIANCSNLVNWQLLSENFTLEQNIDAVQIEADTTNIQPDSTVKFAIYIGQGSHITCIIDFGDDHNQTIKYEDVSEKMINNEPQDDISPTYTLLYDETAEIVSDVSSLGWGKSYSEWSGLIRSMKVAHTYIHPGAFKVQATVHNGVSLEALELEINVEYPITEDLLVVTAATHAQPPGLVPIQFEVNDTQVPSAVVCSIQSEHLPAIESSIFLDIGQPYLVSYTFPRHMSGPVLLDVSCSNHISSRDYVVPCTLEEIITGMTIVPSISEAALGQPIEFTIEFSTGIGSTLYMDFGDGHKEHLAIYNRRFVVDYFYKEPGVYLIEAKSENSFSNISETTYVTVLSILSNLELAGDTDIAIPPGVGDIYVLGTYSLTDVKYEWFIYSEEGTLLKHVTKTDDPNINHDCKDQHNFNFTVMASNAVSKASVTDQVNCYETITGLRIDVGGTGVVYTNGVVEVAAEDPVIFRAKTITGSGLVFQWSLDNDTEVWTTIINDTVSYLFQGVGLHYVHVFAHNPVDNTSIGLPVSTLESVVIGAIRLTSAVIPGKEVSMAVTLSQMGTLPCFHFDPGDGTDQFRFGEGCTYETDLSVTLINSTLNISHTYTESGNYQFKVTGFNHVSQSVKTTKVAVNNKPCFPPKLSIKGTGRNPEIPRIEIKSATIIVTSFTVVHCESTSDVIFTWYGAERGNEDELVPFHQSETTEIQFPPRYFNIGMYRIELMAQMAGTFGMESTDWIYISIIPSPLHVEIFGGVARNVGWNSTLYLNAKQFTFDPDVEPSVSKEDISFTWICSLKHLSGIVQTDFKSEMLGKDELITRDESDCFNSSYISSISPGIIEMNSAHLKFGAVYNFTVVASKGTRSNVADQMVAIVSGTPPQAVVKCRRNCASKMNPSKSFVLQLDCRRCIPGLNIGFHWMIMKQDPSTGEFHQMDNAGEMVAAGEEGLKQKRLITKLDVLERGFRFRIRGTITQGDLAPGYSDYEFVTNLPPHGGQCSIDQEEGFALETDFYITCSDWLDEGENVQRNPETDSSQGLTYTLIEKTSEGESGMIFLLSTSDSEIITKLPEGTEESGYVLDLAVRISDEYGESGEVAIVAKVKTSIEGKNAVLQFITSEDEHGASELDQVLGGRSVSASVSTLLGLTSVLSRAEQGRYHEEDHDKVEEEISMAHDTISAGFSKTAEMITDFSSAQLVVTSMTSLRTETPSNNAQTNILATMKTSTEKLKQVTSGVAVEDVEQIATVLFDNIGYVVHSASTDVTDIYIKDDPEILKEMQIANDAIFGIESPRQILIRLKKTNEELLQKRKQQRQEAKQLLEESQTVMKQMGDIILSAKYATEKPFEANLEAMSVKMAPLHGNHLDGSVQTVGTQGTFTMPSVDQLIGLTITNETLEDDKGNIMMTGIVYNDNPYVWMDSASLVTTAVLDLKFKDVNDSQLQLDETSEGIEVSLSAKLPSAQPVYTTPGHNLTMTYHAFNITSNNTALQITLLPENLTTYFKVWIVRGSYPDVENFEWNFTLPYDPNEAEEQIVLEEDFSHVIYDENMVQGDYKAGIRQYTFENGTWQSLTPQNNYSISFAQLGCQIFDDSLNDWVTDQCKLKLTTENEASRRRRKRAVTKIGNIITFEVKTLAPVAGGLIIPPNLIDFKEVFSNLGARLLDSPVVLSVIAAFIILYIPLLVWARHKDKQDIIKWTIFPIYGNRRSDSYYYKIYIHTGLKRHAGTTSGIYFVLTGEKGNSGVRKLASDKHGGCNQGSVFMYVLTTPKPLGNLVYIRVWHNNKGKGNHKSWFLDEVLIKDLQTQDRYIFICKKWLAVDKVDGKVDRVIAVAGNDNVIDFKNLVNVWTRHTLFDEHIWLSVAVRNRRSNFTRAQRLTCCLVFLFLMMITNAMWYKDTESTEDEVFTLTIGPLIITYYQIYSSIWSNLLIMPVTMLVVQVFKKTDSRTKSFRSALDDFKAFKRRKMINKGIQITEGTSEDVSEDYVWQSTSSHRYPYICIYLGWAVCFLSVLVSAFFTILYSLQWGGDKSSRWLTSFLLTVSESICLFSTAQVFFLVFMFAFLAKTPEEDENEDKEVISAARYCSGPQGNLNNSSLSLHSFTTPSLVNYQEITSPSIKDKLNVKYVPSNEDYSSISPTPSHTEPSEGAHLLVPDDDENLFSFDMDAQGPPSASKLKRTKAIEIARKKFTGFLHSFILRFIYIMLLTAISFQALDSHSYTFNNEIAQTFSASDTRFVDLSGPKAFWHWVDNTLLPGVYAGEFYNNQNASWRDRRYIYNRESFRLGPPRLRQLRIKPGDCDLVGTVRDMILECNPEYSASHEDRKNYFPNWIYLPGNMTDELIKTGSPFIYKSQTELSGLPLYGNFFSYSGGGYTIELAEELEETLAIVNYLKEADWLNLYSRAIVVEFTMYNANINLFNNVQLLFELPSTGGALLKFFVETFRVYAHFGTSSVPVIIAEIVACLILLYYTVTALRELYKQKKKYFKSFSHLLEIIQIVLAFIVISAYITRNVLTQKAVEEVLAAKGIFVNFQKLVTASQMYVAILGMVIFFNSILLLRIIQISPRFRVINYILRDGWPDIISFFVQFFLLFLAFSLFFYAHFGGHRWEYATFIRTLEGLFAVFLGGGADFKVGVAVGEDSMGRGMAFAFAVFLIFTLQNMFIAILVDLFHSGQEEVAKEAKRQKFDPFDYMFSRFYVVLNIAKALIEQIKDKLPLRSGNPVEKTRKLSQNVVKAFRKVSSRKFSGKRRKFETDAHID